MDTNRYHQVVGPIANLNCHVIISSVLAVFLQRAKHFNYSSKRSVAEPDLPLEKQTVTSDISNESKSIKNISHRRNTNFTRSIGTIQLRRTTSTLRFSMTKLSLNVATFTFFNLIYFAVDFYIFSLLTDDDCATRKRVPMAITAFALTWCLQSLRLILDPIISILTDAAVSK
jgi:hypothetical protein